MAMDESERARVRFQAALGLARTRLQPPPAPRERLWPPLAAAALFAACALSFATAAILAPPVQITPIAKPGVEG
jgi:hypothetical protein